MWLILPRVEAGVSLTTLVSFNTTNGANPGAGLVQGTDGNFYGTTAVGGANGNGTIFKVTTGGTLTTLVSFNTTNGANPGAGLLQGTDANFYGTTANGGASGDGTIFEVTTGGTLTTLVSFNGTNGARPLASLVQGQDGNFYGTTQIGGANGNGTVFQMLPNGTLTSLVSFDDSGYSPYAGLVQAADGNFYGAAFLGGADGYGAIFRIATNGALTTLYAFTGGSDGGNPYAGLVQGADGKLYGTTWFGGASGHGSVFNITTNGTLTPLASFGGTNGTYPQAALLLASDGNFYGTTGSGGASGEGTLFQLTPSGTLTTLVSFNGTNGAHPFAGLVQALDGSFYGTTANGGTTSNGTIFRLTVPATITQPPQSTNVCAGGTAQFSVTATGNGPLSYQWQTNSVSLSNGGYYSGVTTSNLTVSAADSSVAGSYSCVVSNAGGSVTSAPAMLTVQAGQLGVSQSLWDFGAVATGVTVQASFTVTNAGCGQLNGTATSAAPFAVGVGSPFTLPGFGATNVVVSFTPPSVGSFSNDVIFTSNGGASTNVVTGVGAIAPLASFTASPTVGPVPLTVNFTDNSTGTISSVSWTFGDGGTANFSAPTNVAYTYTTSGVYTVTLIESGSAGASTNTQTNLITAMDPYGWWASNYFGCATCPQALPGADPLGKGISNTNQFLLGLNPTNPASVFRITAVARSGGGYLITWKTAGPRTNVVQGAVGTANGSYSNNFSDIGGASGVINITLTGDTITNYADQSGTNAYYRIRLVP